jgi:hypothetical protein
LRRKYLQRQGGGGVILGAGYANRETRIGDAADADAAYLSSEYRKKGRNERCGSGGAHFNWS